MNKNELFAIDIGSGKIRGAYAIIDSNNSIKVRSFADAQYGGYMNGELLEPEKLQDTLQNVLSLLEENSAKQIKHLVVGIPSEFCGVVLKQVEKKFTKPTLITKDLINSLLNEVAPQIDIQDNKFLHINFLNFLDDDDEIENLIGEYETQIKIKFSIIYAVSDFCTYLENCISNCGINSIEFIASPLAQAQTLFSENERDLGIAMMDNGMISSFVTTIKGDGLTSLTSFDLGGGHITALLMENLNLTFLQAEELKKKIMLTVNPIELEFYESECADGYSKIPARQVNRYAKLKVEQVASVANACLTKTNFDCENLNTLYVTGSGIAQIKGSKEILTESLQKNINFITSSVDQLTHLSHSALASVIHWWFINNYTHQNIWQKILNLFSIKN